MNQKIALLFLRAANESKQYTCTIKVCSVSQILTCEQLPSITTKTNCTYQSIIAFTNIRRKALDGYLVTKAES